jgi:hypothetical protein
MQAHSLRGGRERRQRKEGEEERMGERRREVALNAVYFGRSNFS